MAANHRKSIRDLAIIYVAAWMRSFGIGLLGVVLGVFLYREGFSSTAIGLVIAAGLAGAATGTVFITFKADHLGRRQTLFALSLLTAAGSLPLIFHFGLAAMIVIAFLGMLNGMGSDRSPAFALEQATIPGLVADEKRTWAWVVQRGAGRERRDRSTGGWDSNCGAKVVGRGPWPLLPDVVYRVRRHQRADWAVVSILVARS